MGANALRLVCLAVAAALLTSACADEDLVEAPATPEAPATSTPEPASTPRALEGGLAVEFWAPPQPGWVLVLDTNDHQPRAQLLLVDPAASEVRGRITAGTQPYAALAPDGATLYLGSWGDGELVALDLATAGARWSAPVALPQTTVPARYPFVEVSADGALLYLDAYSPSGGGPWPAVVDTRTGEVIAPADRSRRCNLAFFARAPGGSDVLGLCSGGLFHYRIEDGALVERPLDVELPQFDQPAIHTRSRVVGIAGGSAAGEVYVATSDGRIVAIEEGSGGTRQKTLDLEFPDRKVVPYVLPLVAPEGARLYLPVQREVFCDGCHGLGSADSIEVIQLPAGDLVATIVPDTNVSALAVDGGRARLYHVDIDAGSLVIVDTATFEEIGRVQLDAVTPAQLFVLP